MCEHRGAIGGGTRNAIMLTGDQFSDYMQLRICRETVLDLSQKGHLVVSSDDRGGFTAEYISDKGGSIHVRRECFVDCIKDLRAFDMASKKYII